MRQDMITNIQAKTVIDYCRYRRFSEGKLLELPSPDKLEKYCASTFAHGGSAIPLSAIYAGRRSFSEPKRKLLDQIFPADLQRGFWGIEAIYTMGPQCSNLWRALAGPPHSTAAIVDMANLLGVSQSDLNCLNEMHLRLLFREFPEFKYIYIAYMAAKLHENKQPELLPGFHEKGSMSSVLDTYLIYNGAWKELKLVYGLETDMLYPLLGVSDWFDHCPIRHDYILSECATVTSPNFTLSLGIYLISHLQWLQHEHQLESENLVRELQSLRLTMTPIARPLKWDNFGTLRS